MIHLQLDRQLIVRTIRSKRGITYCAPGFRRFVPFGRDQAHHPKGKAFAEAAAEQERKAKEWLDKHSLSLHPTGHTFPLAESC